MSDLHDDRVNAANHALTRSIHGPDADHEDFDYYRKHTAIALAAADAVVTVEMIAEVLYRHVVGKLNGGTASRAWYDCSCGHREEVYGGTRDLVEARAKRHQARALTAVLRGGEAR